MREMIFSVVLSIGLTASIPLFLYAAGYLFLKSANQKT